MAAHGNDRPCPFDAAHRSPENYQRSCRSATQTMPRKGRSTQEIVHALHQVEGGEKVAEVGRRLGVGEQTFYR